MTANSGWAERGCREQVDPVRVRQTEIQHRYFRPMLRQQTQGLGAGRGKSRVVLERERPLVALAQHGLVLNEQDAPQGHGESHAPNIALGRAGFDLEEVVELGQDQQEPELVVGTAEHDHLATLRRLALDQHQRAKPGGIHGARAAKVDDQPPSAFRQLVQQPHRVLAEVGTALEPEMLGGRYFEG